MKIVDGQPDGLNLLTTDDATKLGQLALTAIENVIGNIPGNSPLFTDLNFLIEHHESYLYDKSWDETYTDDNFRETLRREVGTIEVAKRVVFLDRLGELSRFKESLELLRLAGVSQAAKLSDYDIAWGIPADQTRLLFEFYTASGIRLLGGRPVEIAGKNNPENPDVLIGQFPIESVTCKVSTGNHLQSLIDNITKGSDQIGKSSAKSGLVIVDIRHRVDDELLFAKIEEGKYRTFLHPYFAQKAIADVLHEVADEILNATTEEERQEWYVASKCKAFVLTAHSCSIVETREGPVPTNTGQAITVPYVAYGDSEIADALTLSQWIGGHVEVDLSL